MKRIITAILAIMIISVFLLNDSELVYAKKSESTPPKKAVMISIYDDLYNEYLLPNTKLSIDEPFTILQSIIKLKDEKFIADYMLTNDFLSSVTTNDDVIRKAEQTPYETEFYVKRNGKILERSQSIQSVQNGDIIEWVYDKTLTIEESITASSHAASSEMTSSVPLAPIGAVWDKANDQALNNAANWLERNRESSNSYLITMGVSGKNVNVKQVNSLVNTISKPHEYNSPTEIAKDIMSATFCGLDASSAKYGQLVTILSNYHDIMKQGIFGAVNTLMAYDINQYKISSSAVNTRDTLIKSILEYQNEDGGFPIMKNGSSDIDTTAMALTVLSNYAEETAVGMAIDNALLFLEENQTESGGFGYKGQENCESLCTVIVALSSLKIDLHDKRFIVGKKTLLDLLLLYQNDDGGFGHLGDDNSSVMPTEQAIVAITAAKRCESPYKLTKPVEQYKEDIPSTNTPTVLEKGATWIGFAVVGILLIGVIIIIVSHKISRN